MQQNYHLQLPPPSNAIILGGGRQYTVHNPEGCFPNDEEDEQFPGIADFFQSWPSADVAGWPASSPPELARDVNDGGCWTGSKCHRLLLTSLDWTLLTVRCSGDDCS